MNAGEGDNNDKKLNVAKMGSALRSYATHHNHGEGWTYTRDLHGLKTVRLVDDWKGRNSPAGRLKRAFNIRALLGRDHLSKSLGLKNSWRSSLAYFEVALRTENHLPDGTLNDGIVTTVWEEDGEYIEWVGPTVGEKIADFLVAEPDHPHAIAIAEEMRRVRQLGIDRRNAEPVSS